MKEPGDLTDAEKKKYREARKRAEEARMIKTTTSLYYLVPACAVIAGGILATPFIAPLLGLNLITIWVTTFFVLLTFLVIAAYIGVRDLLRSQQAIQILSSLLFNLASLLPDRKVWGFLYKVTDSPLTIFSLVLYLAMLFFLVYAFTPGLS